MSPALSLKASSPTPFHTGETLKIAIGGDRLHKPRTAGWAILALYGHVNLPKAGSPERKALARGGWQAWFQQVAPVAQEADRRDETGLLGLVPFAAYGPNRLLIAHSWPHTVDADPWEFCLQAWAYGPSGAAMRVPLSLTVREVKVVPL